MKYLLIDFGATYIKCAVYNKQTGEVSTANHFTSPFENKSTITSEFLFKLLNDIITQYEKVDGIVICTILGGQWHNNIYYSWKMGLEPGKSCLIGGLFKTISHEDHKPFTIADSYYDKLSIIAYINDTPIYCALGDTNCVIRSLDLKFDEVAINMGTGSQVITKSNIHRFFPAGRSFLVYQQFFKSMGLDMFTLMNHLTLEDAINSPLEVNLNTFKQSRDFNEGGYISKIIEGNFTVNNFLGALLRTFVTQYKEVIANSKRIILVGGIPKKLPMIHKLFDYYYPDAYVSLNEHDIESTHKGMIKYINEQL